MTFKMKGPSMHKGTSGHKKALNKYQELAVDRSGDPSPNKMKEADEKQTAPKPKRLEARKKGDAAGYITSKDYKAHSKSEKFLKKDNPKPNTDSEKEMTGSEKEMTGEDKSKLLPGKEFAKIAAKRKVTQPKEKPEGDSPAKMAGMVAKKAGQKAAAKGAKKVTQAVADKQGIDSPAKMGSKSPTKAALKGKQHNLPEDLKAKIKASPAKIIPGLKKKGTKGTKFVDKVKAFGGAIAENVGKVHGHGGDDTLTRNTYRTYKRLKKQSREAEGQGMKKSAKPQTPPKTVKEKRAILNKMKKNN
jgi:hypothetical protein